jgi:hypothetical protein
MKNRGCGEVEANQVFQAGWSDCREIPFFHLPIVLVTHLAFPSARLELMRVQCHAEA